MTADWCINVLLYRHHSVIIKPAIMRFPVLAISLFLLVVPNNVSSFWNPFDFASDLVYDSIDIASDVVDFASDVAYDTAYDVVDTSIGVVKDSVHLGALATGEALNVVNSANRCKYYFQLNSGSNQ